MQQVSLVVCASTCWRRPAASPVGASARRRAPSFLHHPLLMKSPTQKLSKSDGDSGIRELRARGWSAGQVIGRGARRTAGWGTAGERPGCGRSGRSQSSARTTKVSLTRVAAAAFCHCVFRMVNVSIGVCSSITLPISKLARRFCTKSREQEPFVRAASFFSERMTRLRETRQAVQPPGTTSSSKRAIS